MLTGMEITIKTCCENVPWEDVSALLKEAGLSQLDAAGQKSVFEHSTYTVFAYENEKLCGIGRALSDTVCQGSIYNVAVAPHYRGNGLGSTIIRTLLDCMKGQHVILYTHPSDLAFYEKLGFRRSKTAFCLFDDSSEMLSWLEAEGFFLPKGWRFAGEENALSPTTAPYSN